MKIGAVQYDIQWNNPHCNHSLVEQEIENNLSDCDIIVLPEMFATGFSMKPEKIAQNSEGESVTWMKHIARKYNVAIVGSVATVDTDSSNKQYFSNRLYFVTEEGDVKYIDKRHLFRMAGEEKVYRAGERREVIEYRGVKFLPLVCYDVRFPVWSRIVKSDYDVIIYVASWPDTRIYAWDTLLRARAIENQSYVVGVNRVGSDKAANYNGHSVIIDYKGEVIGEIEENKIGSFSAEISLDKLNEFRQSFPVSLDADMFNLE